MKLVILVCLAVFISSYMVSSAMLWLFVTNSNNWLFISNGKSLVIHTGD